MSQAYLTDPNLLRQIITGLRVELHTVDAPYAATDDEVHCNVGFRDGPAAGPAGNFS